MTYLQVNMLNLQANLYKISSVEIFLPKEKDPTYVKTLYLTLGLHVIFLVVSL